jgi:AcrR family transcriptional regulator
VLHRILDIALELFTEQGYDKTSLRDIVSLGRGCR